MAKDLSKIAKQKKIKYFLISFVDLFGVLRSKLVPTEAIKEMQNQKREDFLIWLKRRFDINNYVEGSTYTPNKIMKIADTFDFIFLFLSSNNIQQELNNVEYFQ